MSWLISLLALALLSGQPTVNQAPNLPGDHTTWVVFTQDDEMVPITDNVVELKKKEFRLSFAFTKETRNVKMDVRLDNGYYEKALAGAQPEDLPDSFRGGTSMAEYAKNEKKRLIIQI